MGWFKRKPKKYRVTMTKIVVHGGDAHPHAWKHFRVAIGRLAAQKRFFFKSSDADKRLIFNERLDVLAQDVFDAVPHGSTVTVDYTLDPRAPEKAVNALRDELNALIVWVIPDVAYNIDYGFYVWRLSPAKQVTVAILGEHAKALKGVLFGQTEVEI